MENDMWQKKLLKVLDKSMIQAIRISQGELPKDNMFSSDIEDIVIAFIKALISFEKQTNGFPDEIIVAITGVINLKTDELLAFIMKHAIEYIKHPEKINKKYKKMLKLK